MKRFLKWVLIATGAIVLFLVIFSFLMKNKFQSEVDKMSPLPTGPVIENIMAVKDDFVNMYVIKNGGDIIAIDAANNVDNVLKGLKSLDINPDNVRAVFLTHSDADHTASLTLFKNAEIYISKEEEQMLNGKTARSASFKNKPIGKHLLLDDGQTIDAGSVRVKCVITPGHTPGSSCYVVNDTYLFTGDSLSLKNGKVEVFNEFFNMDSKKEIQSWDKIRDIIGVKYIVTAHYGYTDYSKAFEK